MIDVLGLGITFVSFCAALLLAQFIFKYTPSLNSLANRQGRYIALDGLRGFLAFSVFIHHFIITWYWKVNGEWMRPPEDYFQNLGRAGVSIFFIITGFLFISKIIQTDSKLNWLKLYESRIFRIFPLYFFTLMIISFVVFSSSNYELNVSFSSLLSQYFNWGIFIGDNINGFLNTRKVIAGVDWTLKYEWVFYLSLPILAAIFYKFGKIGGAVLFFACAFLFLFPKTFFSFSTTFLIFFAFGGLAALTVNTTSLPASIIKGKVVSSIVCLAIVAILFYPNTLNSIHISLIFLVFILVALGNDLFGVFSLRSSILLGEISYSIYLLHGVVLYFAFTFIGTVEIKNYTFQEYLFLMPIISVVIVLFSSMTFILIERPCINFGRKYYLSNAISRAKLNTNKTYKD